MSTHEMEFRYFRYPHRFSTYRSAPETCAVCGQKQPGYAGPFYGLEEIDFVCETCLAAGRLAEKGAFTNDGDDTTLRSQIAHRHPEMSAEALEAEVDRRTAELEQRTPHMVTWQDFSWPAHCGDYCCFVKEAGKDDLNTLAADGNGLAFFESHLYRTYLGDDMEDVWKGIRPESPQDNAFSFPIGVYLFQCLQCREYVLLWDMD